MQKHPEIVEFDAADILGGIANKDDPSKLMPGHSLEATGRSREILRMQCFPVYSILLALGRVQAQVLLFFFKIPLSFRKPNSGLPYT